MWKTWTGHSGVVEHGLEVPNLRCPKSYQIRNTITNFQKLNFKNEVYLTLKNESLFHSKKWVLGPDFRVYDTSESRKAKV